MPRLWFSARVFPRLMGPNKVFRALSQGAAHKLGNFLLVCSLATAVGSARLCPAAAEELETSQVVRVGVYENTPIILTQPAGTAAGLAIQVLDAIAEAEGWTVQYQNCEWNECLELLRARELDLLPGIAYSEERAELFRFSEVTVISNFGVVYSPRKSEIGSFLDLEGKTIAVLEGNIHAQALQDLLNRFGVSSHILNQPSFDQVIQQVATGKVDAGLVNRLFGLGLQSDQRVAATSIIFNPIEVRFASPKQADGTLLAAIDRHLRAFKATPGSVYYNALGRWLPEARLESRVPKWIYWALGGTLTALILALLTNYVLQREVRRRTRRLRQEIRERRKAQNEYHRAAFYDRLTDLPNRILLRDRLGQAIAEAREKNQLVALLFLNLDSFQSINETLGTGAGNELLGLVANRLRGCLRESDTLARVGTDEFAVVLRAPENALQVEHTARKLLEAQRIPFEIDARELIVTASIGSATFPDDGTQAEEVLRNAEIAMASVKRGAHDGYSPYELAMTDQIAERESREILLRSALAKEELVVTFQPIVSLTNGSAIGAEALIRLLKPDGSWLYPGSFIPLAEDFGLIGRFGRLALTQACQEAVKFLGLVPNHFRLSVNVSPYQLNDSEFLENLDFALSSSGIPGSQLQLELTEGVFLDSLSSRQHLLDALKERQIELAIDDFGTGYSSLSYLRRLPLSTLKIDRVFIQDLEQDRGSRKIVKAIIQMAQALNLKVIAEGIETHGQLDALRRMNCAFGQGFLFSRSVIAEELEIWLQNAQSSTANNSLMADAADSLSGKSLF